MRSVCTILIRVLVFVSVVWVFIAICDMTQRIAEIIP